MVTRDVPVSGSNEGIHILAQCIPVISPENCSKCLSNLYGYVLKDCNSTQGGVAIHPNCIIKFKSYVGGAYVSSIPNFYLYVFSVMFFFV